MDKKVISFCLFFEIWLNYLIINGSGTDELRVKEHVTVALVPRSDS